MITAKVYVICPAEEAFLTIMVNDKKKYRIFI